MVLTTLSDNDLAIWFDAERLIMIDWDYNFCELSFHKKSITKNLTFVKLTYVECYDGIANGEKTKFWSAKMVRALSKHFCWPPFLMKDWVLWT